MDASIGRDNGYIYLDLTLNPHAHSSSHQSIILSTFYTLSFTPTTTLAIPVYYIQIQNEARHNPLRPPPGPGPPPRQHQALPGRLLRHVLPLRLPSPPPPHERCRQPLLARPGGLDVLSRDRGPGGPLPQGPGYRFHGQWWCFGEFPPPCI